MTLRRRLILSVAVLIALLGLTIGLVSTLALNGVLVSRLDAQLPGSRAQSGSTSVPPPGTYSLQLRGGDATTFLDRQPTGTVGAIISGGQLIYSGAVVANTDTSSLTNEIAALSASQAGQLQALPTGKAPVTVDLGGSLGQYRVVSLVTTSGDTAVIGLSLASVQNTVGQQIIVTLIVTVLGLIVAVFIGGLIIRYSLRPLQRVADTAEHVAELPLDRGEVALAVRVPESDTNPNTEVGRVGSALNRMLEHVASALTSRQQSEDKVRQFVADASHELRTPLASIRGYAELTRRQDHQLPDDVTHSLTRIESEAKRMTSLVEDLLLLARLDSRPDVAHDTVDLTLTLVDAVSDAHAAGRDHDWILDLPEEPIEIEGDGPRLYQITTNLLANARLHTPPGTHVTAGLAEEVVDGVTYAVISVTDDGPGIDAEILPTLFERFVRGDVSRSRHAGSTGLGLAIVYAVAEAHGGTVTVESVPGNTVFRVLLPVVWRGAAA
ncbi:MULTISPECIES: sensor histidine kinase [Subtercola]|uniref:histidine kinase n=1 Tax=Subtercola vilae TaxID=2056433 RepID=A0A4T2C5U9_9MICO|nr:MULTISPECIES: HAMP domain-containing sensor histidine kinase [Subtercola]MEA9986883.1 HAMP domain-containing sensor histidine kinase [Subtercola sp. RTI3]TIH38952.1 sensor histidine kinase [Subtercola vilae]